MAREATAASLEEQIRRMTPVAAPPEQRAGVAAMFKLLDKTAHAPRHLPRATCKLVGPSGESIVVPESVFYVLERVTEVMARGDSITIVPVGQEMTTQKAADMLNISRQYLVRLLEEGRIPYTKTGKHRRLRLDDVLAFKQRRDDERHVGLDELTKMSQEFGGYGEVK